MNTQFQLGVTTKFLGAWDLFGGFESITGKDETRSLLVVKQTNAGVDTQGVKVAEIKGKLEEALKQLNDNKPVTLTVDFAGLDDILKVMEVYVKEVYLKVEEVKPTGGSSTKYCEFAFWIGIQLDKKVREALNAKQAANFYFVPHEETALEQKIDNTDAKTLLTKDHLGQLMNEQELEALFTNKTELLTSVKKALEFQVPPLFKLVRIEDLFVKVWGTTDATKPSKAWPEVMKEMMLTPLAAKYSALPAPPQK